MILIDFLSKFFNIKPKPEPEPIITIGESIFLQEYDVMILDGIEEDYIKKSLMLIPNIVRFKIIPVDWNQIDIDKEKTPWENFVYPKKNRDNLIVIFDGVTRDVIYGGGACIQDEKYHRIGISTAGVENDPYQMSLRIWHEIQHTLDRDGSADMLYYCNEFYESMPAEIQQHIRMKSANHPIYLLLYNFYLSLKTLERVIDEGGKS